MITIILGAPGTGKGTVSDYLVKNHGYKHVSTGNIFKKIMQSESSLGAKVAKLVNAGKLIDDKMTAEILVDGLANYDLKKDKIILDGYPRNLTQALFLESFLEKNNLHLGKVINLEVPEEILIKRLSARIICPKCGRSYSKIAKEQKPKVEWICDYDQTTLVQRPDDQPQHVELRLNIFYEQTFPLVKYYQEQDNLIIYQVEGMPVEELAKKIEEANGTN